MEQRDQSPEQPADDIGRAAAEAASQAGEYEAGPEDLGPAADRRPRRLLVIGGVAVAALALAGGAAAIAGHSRPPRSDTALNAAAARTQSTSSPTSPQVPTATADTSTAAPTTPSTPSSTTAPSKTPSSTSKSSPSKSPSSSPSQQPNGEGGDCENTTHDTPADEARNFSGMTHGTQQAFQAAQKAAQSTGLTFLLNSGYRSAAYQQRVFDCWVQQLGSAQAARQYALPPDESAHVQGYAMDIAPPSAAAWLQSTKGQFGLCRRYSDETWHFEYQARYKTQGCPALLPHP